MKVEYKVCDRCKKKIEYKGWTGIFKRPLKNVKLRKLYYGNISGYDYSDNEIEICADCVKSFEKWLKGRTNNETDN